MCRSIKSYNLQTTGESHIHRSYSISKHTPTRRFMSSPSNEQVSISQIGKLELKEIVATIETYGREDSGYVVMDVRGEDEIEYTGKLADCVHTAPLPDLAMKNAFKLSEEDFEEEFGFSKPQMDETLVFTCKAGIRSMHAAQLARMAGYSNLVNYVGGSMDWFSGKDDFQF